MAKLHLTDLAVQKLPHPTNGDIKYWDTSTAGFGIRVTKNAKSFFISYGRDRRIKSLGKYPSTSLKMARAAAKRFQTIQSPPGPNITLEMARDAYIEDCKGRLREGTWKNYEIILNQLDDKPLLKITKSDVGNNAHRIMALKIFFNWCLRQELVDRNPFAIERVSYGTRDRVLTNLELKAIWEYDRQPFSDYLKLLLLTGQRRSQFNQFEIREDNLFFAASIMKNKQDHLLPLLPLARQYAENLLPFNSWSKSKKILDEAIQLPHWTIHDLRRTHSTIQASIGTPIHITEAILSHTSGSISGVARTYNRYNYLNESREALAKFEKHLQSIVV